MEQDCLGIYQQTLIRIILNIMKNTNTPSKPWVKACDKTPRTDEIEYRNSNGELVVDADFARELELEIQDLKVMNEFLFKDSPYTVEVI